MLLTFFIGMLLSLIVSVLVTKIGIPYLTNLKYKQTVREEGPESHKSKNGTPTMGGIFFVLSIMIVGLIFFKFDLKSIYPLITMASFCYIGWKDDYIKVVKQNNLGLTAKEKMIHLIVISFILSLLAAKLYGTILYIPIAETYIELGYLYVPLMMFIFVGTSNAVNLTDGLDGLATSVTIVAVMFIGFICYIFGFESQYLLTGIVAGALFGFLLFNLNPAKIFMGDTGSLALGGLLVGLSLAIKMPFILVAIGIVYVVETLSVIIQVAVFKTTHKRVFKMSPIHHHFELCGLSENKIVSLAVITSIIGGVVALLAI